MTPEDMLASIWEQAQSRKSVAERALPYMQHPLRSLKAAMAPQSPADVALMAAGGVGGKIAKPLAMGLTGYLGLGGGEAEAAPRGVVSKLLDALVIGPGGEAIKGGKYTKRSQEVLGEIAAGQKGAGPLDLSATEAHMKTVPQFDLPRYEPARGVSPRLQDALKNPDVRKGIEQSVEEGRALGADKWYHTGALRDAWVNELGPKQGPKDFSTFMDMVAATSPRSDVPTNLRNASYYYGHALKGAPEVGELPYPYGHVAQNLHRGNYAKLMQPTPAELSAGTPDLGTRWDIYTNPKPASFSQNLQGNLMPGTIDTHAFRNIAMRTNDPRFLETSLTQKIGRDPGEASMASRLGEMKGDIVTYRPQQLVKSGKISLEEAKDIPTFWATKPNENEYGAAENLYREIGKKQKLPVADTQAAAWSGAGGLTGLGSSPRHTFPELFNERVLYTSKMRNEPPDVTLSNLIRGKRPLLSLAPGAALAPGVADYLETSNAR